MAPGVLDQLKHLMDSQAPNARVRVEEVPRGPMAARGDAAARGAEGGEEDEEEDEDAASPAATGPSGRSPYSSPSSSSASALGSSVQANFAQAIFLFTTNIGSAQVQKVAFDAAKEGKPRESLSPALLHELLHISLAHSAQMQLLRDSSVLSALIPFFPLFKTHVKECAAVQLSFRRRFWLAQGQLANFTWDASVLSYAASQLKYQGPISLYGCKNIHEILTHSLLAHLTREFRRRDEEEALALENMMRDNRVATARKVWSYGSSLFRRVRTAFQGPEWNMALANVTVRIDVNRAEGKEDIVFDIEEPAPATTATQQQQWQGRKDGGAATPPPPQTVRREIRKPLHAHAHSSSSSAGAAATHSSYQDEPGISRPGPDKHRHITEGALSHEEQAAARAAALKEDL